MTSVRLAQAESQIVVQSLGSDTRQTVLPNAVEARYVDATGHLLYVGGEGGLFAVAFDADRLQTIGGPHSVLPPLGRAANTGGGQYAVSDNGTLAYVPSLNSAELSQLVWVDRNGRKLEDTGASGRGLAHPALASDDAFVAFTVRRGDNLDVVRHNLATTTENTVSTSRENDIRPVWSPSDEWILFQSSDAGQAYGLFTRRADSVGDVQALTTATETGLPAWTGDWGTQSGTEYMVFDRGPNGGVWYQSRMDGDADWNPPVQFQPAPAVVPQFSPDGRYVAYILYDADAAARMIEVAPFPEADRKWPISAPGGSRLRWSPTGTEIFWVQGEDLMHVSVSADGPDLDPGRPERLFTWKGLTAGQYDSASFDVSRDGERFLVIEALTSIGAERPAIHVVQNWFTELKRIAPTE